MPLDEFQELVLGRLHQCELPAGAFAGGDLAANPLVVDVSPGGIGECVEDDVAHVVGRNGAVEIEDKRPAGRLVGQDTASSLA